MRFRLVGAVQVSGNPDISKLNSLTVWRAKKCYANSTQWSMVE